MGKNIKELIQVLEQIITILGEDGDTHWIKWMEECKMRLMDSDYYGIEKLLGAYGGMGSFNDLVVGQTEIDGKIKWKPDAKKKNDKLNELRSRAYNLAEYIKRNHEIEEV